MSASGIHMLGTGRNWTRRSIEEIALKVWEDMGGEDPSGDEAKPILYSACDVILYEMLFAGPQSLEGPSKFRVIPYKLLDLSGIPLTQPIVVVRPENNLMFISNLSFYRQNYMGQGGRTYPYSLFDEVPVFANLKLNQQPHLNIQLPNTNNEYSGQMVGSSAIPTENEFDFKGHEYHVPGIEEPVRDNKYLNYIDMNYGTDRLKVNTDGITYFHYPPEDPSSSLNNYNIFVRWKTGQNEETGDAEYKLFKVIHDDLHEFHLYYRHNMSALSGEDDSYNILKTLRKVWRKWSDPLYRPPVWEFDMDFYTVKFSEYEALNQFLQDVISNLPDPVDEGQVPDFFFVPIFMTGGSNSMFSVQDFFNVTYNPEVIIISQDDE